MEVVVIVMGVEVLVELMVVMRVVVMVVVMAMMTVVIVMVVQLKVVVIMMTVEMVTVVVVVMVDVQTKLVHPSGSQTLHIEPFETHSRGPLTPGAIRLTNAGHREGWEDGFEKARAHSAETLNSQHCFLAWLKSHLLSCMAQEGFGPQPQA